MNPRQCRTSPGVACVYGPCYFGGPCVVEIERKMEDAADERAAFGKWKTMESAPRDGTNILLAWGQDGVSQGHYVPGLQGTHPWKFIDTNDGITWLINHAVDGPGGPTHWMPMPKWMKAPAGVATDGGRDA